MDKEVTNYEIRRVFKEEWGQDVSAVLLGITKKCRMLLAKPTFTQNDMDLASSMLNFVAEHIPHEPCPNRIDFIKELIWQCINRGYPKKIYDETLETKNKWVNNFVWHPQF